MSAGRREPAQITRKSRWNGLCVAGRMTHMRIGLLVAVLLVLAAAHAFAQTLGSAGAGSANPTNGINVTLRKAGNDEYTDASHTIPINQRECQTGSLTVDLTGLPANGASGGYMYLEIWAQTGTADCSTADRDISVVPESQCTRLNTAPIRLNGSTEIRGQPVALSAAGGPNSGNSAANVCDGSDSDVQGPRAIYFLALRGGLPSESTTVFGTLNIQIQTVPPQPATNVVGYTGETEIPVKWTLPAERIYSYYVIIDPAAEHSELQDSGAGPGCESQTLNAIQDFDFAQPPHGLRILGPIAKSASEITLNGDDLHTDVAAVAIVVGDIAKNYSKLSNIGCITITPTSGFWDAYTNEGGAAEPGCSCALPGEHSAGRAVHALAILSVLACFGLRRRRA
jgi:hypothetical protein